MLSLLLPLALFSPPQNAYIPSKDWKAILTEGKERSEVMSHLDHLTNRIGPRLTSSNNLQNACEWARDYLKSIGYENARLEKWGTFPVGFNRGPSFGRITAPKAARGALVIMTRAWSAGTKGRQEGPLIPAPRNLAEAKTVGEQLAGCWLMREAGGPGGRRFQQEHVALRGFCASMGALGFVAGARRGKTERLQNLLVTSGNHRIQWDALPTFPEIFVRWDQAQRLHQLLEDGAGVRLAIDVRNWFRRGPIPLYNVIADLEGSKKPDEYVVVGGHIDSWDGATGTTDNGTGTATTLEAARILKTAAVKPKRTIRFMLWSGEEQGLLGSRAWAQKNRKLVHDKVSACFVHDGGTNPVVGINGYPEQLPFLKRAFRNFGKIDHSFPFEVSAGGQHGGSDHYSFLMVGSPGFFWNQKGDAIYTRTHHTQHDTFDAANRDYQKHTATVVALGALAVANLPKMLPRFDKNQLRRGRPRGVQQGGLGITVDENLVVTNIDKGSIAERSGVKRGDKLLELQSQKLDGPSTLARAVRRLENSKKKGTLIVERRGKRRRIRLRAPKKKRQGR